MAKLKEIILKISYISREISQKIWQGKFELICVKSDINIGQHENRLNPHIWMDGYVHAFVQLRQLKGSHYVFD